MSKIYGSLSGIEAASEETEHEKQVNGSKIPIPTTSTNMDKPTIGLIPRQGTPGLTKKRDLTPSVNKINRTETPLNIDKMAEELDAILANPPRIFESLQKKGIL